MGCCPRLHESRYTYNYTLLHTYIRSRDITSDHMILHTSDHAYATSNDHVQIRSCDPVHVKSHDSTYTSDGDPTLSFVQMLAN